MQLAISPLQLKELLAHQEHLQLIDVREPEEWDICHLGGQLIPMGDLIKRVDQLDRHRPIVLICHHGLRSAQALQYLRQRHGFTNVQHLKGGLHAWTEEVDPTFPIY